MSASSTVKDLHAALTSILPEACTMAVAQIEPQVNTFSEECAHLADAAPHRINEFLTGRQCARAALASQGVGAVAIISDADGVPVWPEAWRGSITHSRGLCVAVVGAESRYTYLGLDLEKTNRLGEAAIKRVVHADEAAWVAGDQSRASLLFSAKEAFYKAQFPQWRCPGNFHDLVLEVDEAKQVASIAKLSEQFPQELRAEANSFQFHYQFVDDYVVTLCSHVTL